MSTTTVLQSGEETAQISNWKGTMLVTGTCVGAGMLAMPIQAAATGFVISSLVLFTSWIFMSFTGLLLVEATLWLKGRSHFSSIAQALLGAPGKILCLGVYLFMNSTSLVAYTSGGSILMDYWLKSLFRISAGYTTCCILFTLLFGGFVYLGVAFIGRINNWFNILMGIIYCYLIAVGIFSISPDNLAFRPAWAHAAGSFPIIFAAFSYQMIVPSLCSYLKYDFRQLRKAILIGTSIPFAVYFLWLLLIHGIIPYEGAGGLREAAQNSTMIVEPLKSHLSSSFLPVLIDGFAFFALVTSYFGLSVALLDFVRDLLRGVWQNPSKGSITLISLIPCMLLAILFPNALLDCLDMSGGFGDALLSGLIPVSMVWIGRYRQNLVGEYTAPGGKLALIAAGSFAFIIFVVQWAKLFW